MVHETDINGVKIFYFGDRFPTHAKSVKSLKGLEKVVLFPDSNMKDGGIINSSVWVFDANNHKFNEKVSEDIFGDDVGCGMAAFLVDEIKDYKKATEKVYDLLAGKKILGRGNHFVDICSELWSPSLKFQGHNLIVIHSDGKSYDNSMAKTYEDALKKQKNAEVFREDLGTSIMSTIGAKGYILGNWTHNSVELKDEKYIYRKSAIKVKEGKLHIFPSRLNETILFYSPRRDNMPICDSMPHASGRSGPRGKTKVESEVAGEIREYVYIPERISNDSLRTEHFSCYNPASKIFDYFKENTLLVAESEILGYVGKI